MLETSAGAALAEAHAAGLTVIVKEGMANGRLAAPDAPEPLRRLAAETGAGQDAVALAAVLHQPWAGIVLSGAATVAQAGQQPGRRPAAAGRPAAHRPGGPGRAARGVLAPPLVPSLALSSGGRERRGRAAAGKAAGHAAGTAGKRCQAALTFVAYTSTYSWPDRRMTSVITSSVTARSTYRSRSMPS